MHSYNKTNQLKECIAMNNERYYLLTGAAGFLGSNICAQLPAAGKKVRALVLPNNP